MSISSNITTRAGALRPSSQKKRTKFFDALKKLGVSVTFRVSFGEDILAACGQLAGKNKCAMIKATWND